MERAAKRRWAVLLAALATTIAAIAYPVEEDVVAPEVAASPVAPASAPHRFAEDANITELAWVATEDDPFAARGWQPPAPPAPEPIKAPPTVATVDVPPPPPPLPYKFVGQMQDGDQLIVYLSRGEQVLLAHQGDVLDGSYKVLAIDRAQVEFESISSGIKQTLAIPTQEN